MGGILIYSGCYNKILQTGWLINKRSIFLIVLEAGGLRSGVLAWLNEGQVGNLLCLHVAEGARELCWPLFFFLKY